MGQGLSIQWARGEPDGPARLPAQHWGPAPHLALPCAISCLSEAWPSSGQSGVHSLWPPSKHPCPVLCSKQEPVRTQVPHRPGTGFILSVETAGRGGQGSTWLPLQRPHALGGGTWAE